ncbi:MAG: pyruvate dehydrogenase (acetyl-transferring) E1 component subunit alpha [Anaerolineales bacterium]
MPRKVIDLEYRVEHLSILDKDGKVDEDLEPDIPDELLLKMYRSMLLARRFDERMLKLQRQGRIGTFAPVKGQEAAQLGSIALLNEDDWMVPAFRETAAELWRGRKMENILLYFGGYEEGGEVSEGVNNLPISVPVGSQMLHAVGIAWGIKYREEKQVVITYFGDGATSQGDFHEALNFAGVFQLPVIFLNQNNQWAISVSRERQTSSQTLAQKALGQGVPGIQVDGNDILAVYVATQEAVERARKGEGPTMIEAVTYRMSVHTTADDPTRYREEEEVKEWEERDPLDRFQIYLKEKGLLTDEKIAELEEEVDKEIREAVQVAEEKMEDEADPLLMFKYDYAEMPPYLEEQREAMKERLQEKEA